MPFVYSAAAMLNPEILELLVCPESHQKIVPAEQSLVDELNQRIDKGELRTHAGEPVKAPLTAALVREDRKCVYRVDDDIPNLLVDERIDL